MRTLPLAALFIATATQAQFQLQDSHTTASLRGIHSLGNGVAWASGTEGTILRTTDNGATWQRCTTPPDAEKLDFRGIQAFDQNTAIVMSSGKGDLSRLYKTTDACKSWKLLFTNPDKDGFWDAIYMPSSEVGWLLGDPVAGRFRLWSTADGGKHWTLGSRKGLNAESSLQGAFAASNSSLTTTSSPIWRMAFGTGGREGAFFYSIKTLSICLDDCPPSEAEPKENWQRNEVPIASQTESAGIFSLARTDSVLVAMGGDYKKPDDANRTAAYSIDHGKTWQSSATPPHGYRSSVAYDAKTKTWITVGPNGTDISRDDGRNWTALKPTAQDPPDADKNWNALSLPFVVGPKGRIGKLRPEALKP